MNTMSNDEFADFVTKLAEEAPAFKPSATYDPDGDCIEFIAKPDSFYGERIDDLVTVYYSHETNDIVGSLIKGASGFYKTVLDKLPGFKIEIQDGKVRLEHVFLAKLWSSELDLSNLAVLEYRKLIEIAEETKVQAPVFCGN
jgi:hypothetical protein